MQEQGLPDLVNCFHGRFVGLEVKQPGEKPSPKQRQILGEIEAAGGIARVVTTVKEVADLLAEIEKEVDN